MFCFMKLLQKVLIKTRPNNFKSDMILKYSKHLKYMGNNEAHAVLYWRQWYTFFTNYTKTALRYRVSLKSLKGMHIIDMHTPSIKSDKNLQMNKVHLRITLLHQVSALYRVVSYWTNKSRFNKTSIERQTCFLTNNNSNGELILV